MQRKRINWRAAAAVAAGVVMLAAGGAIWAMDTAVNWTLRELSAERPAEKPAERSTQADDANRPSGVEQTPAEPSRDVNAQDDTKEDPDDVSYPATAEPAPATPLPPGKEEPSDKPAQPDEASEAPDPSDSSNELEYTPNISAEHAEAVQEQVTLTEKATVAATLMKSFTAAELKQFAEMAKDGISVEEKRALRGMFVDRLSEDEYNRLIEIAAKYGLSAGKTYDQVAAEEKRGDAE